MFDYLVVGRRASPASVLAERLAAEAGKKVLIVDQAVRTSAATPTTTTTRPAFSCTSTGRTSSTPTRATCSTTCRASPSGGPYQHRVRAWVDGQLLPIPINLDTVNTMYGLNLTSFQLEEFFESVAEPRAQVRTSEDVIVSKVGRELYEKFFRNYTRKQWDLDPSELDAAVTARVPVRTNRDDRYFTDTYQAMPLHGYTRMFERMLDHTEHQDHAEHRLPRDRADDPVSAK